jgi:hypothetical protein
MARAPDGCAQGSVERSPGTLTAKVLLRFQHLRSWHLRWDDRAFRFPLDNNSELDKILPIHWQNRNEITNRRFYKSPAQSITVRLYQAGAKHRVWLICIARQIETRFRIGVFRPRMNPIMGGGGAELGWKFRAWGLPWAFLFSRPNHGERCLCLTGPQIRKILDGGDRSENRE